MPRIRTIKPEFWTDEKLANVPLQARLIYIGIWTYADDTGVLRASNRLLKSQILPYDDSIRLDVFSKWVDALIDARMLIPFKHKEESYLYVRTFSDHQKIDKPSKPLIDRSEVSKLITLDEYSGSTSRAVVPVIVSSNSKSNSKSVAKKFSPPTLSEVLEYFKEKGANETLAKKAFDHYSSGNWKDSKGMAVKNWKQKMLTNWINSGREQISEVKQYSRPVI